MRIRTISVSQPEEIEFRGKTYITSIFKKPVKGAIRVTSRNLEGDRQADLNLHGGPHSAVYAYPYEHYSYWSAELGRELEPAQFGENLTIEGMDESDVMIGDHYEMGDAVLEVTQPRLPCSKLGVRMNDETFPNKFMLAGKLGCYFRVETDGYIQADDYCQLIFRHPVPISIHDLWRIGFTKTGEGRKNLVREIKQPIRIRGATHPGSVSR